MNKVEAAIDELVALIKRTEKPGRFARLCKFRNERLHSAIKRSADI